MVTKKKIIGISFPEGTSHELLHKMLNEIKQVVGNEFSIIALPEKIKFITGEKIEQFIEELKKIKKNG